MQDVYGDDLEKLKSTKRFVPDKDFSGASAQGASGSRDGPVQFEMMGSTLMGMGDDDAGAGEEEDPFGLEKFLSEAKKGSGGTGMGGSGVAGSSQSASGSKRSKTELAGYEKSSGTSSSKRKR